MKFNLLIILFSLNCFSLFGQTENLKLDSTKKSIIADSIEVKVIVEFAIAKSGDVTNVKIKSIDCSDCSYEDKLNCKKEALRVIREMPPWEPKKRKTYFSLPIVFRVENTKK